jgi:site-specific recombinase XerD
LLDSDSFSSYYGNYDLRAEKTRKRRNSHDRFTPKNVGRFTACRVYYREFGDGSEFLYPHKESHISIDTLQIAFRKALRASGVNKPATVHTLRHSYATYLLENGENLSTIKDILGHSSIVTTDIYTHVTEKTTAHLWISLDGMLNGFQP